MFERSIKNNTLLLLLNEYYFGYNTNIYINYIDYYDSCSETRGGNPRALPRILLSSGTLLYAN